MLCAIEIYRCFKRKYTVSSAEEEEEEKKFKCSECQINAYHNLQ